MPLSGVAHVGQEASLGDVGLFGPCAGLLDAFQQRRDVQRQHYHGDQQTDSGNLPLLPVRREQQIANQAGETKRLATEQVP